MKVAFESGIACNFHTHTHTPTYMTHNDRVNVKLWTKYDDLKLNKSIKQFQAKETIIVTKMKSNEKKNKNLNTKTQNHR